MSSERKFFVGGNWKCNGDPKFVEELLSELNAGLGADCGVEVVVAPPALFVSQALSLSRCAAVAAQNAYPKCGAFTGEVSVSMLSALRVPWLIAGHSERRDVFGDSDAAVAAKAAAALDAGLSVIACCGESLAEREAGRTREVVLGQLEALRAAVAGRWAQVVVAYEPKWAIGTGKTATPAQAQEVHADIRKFLEEKEQAGRTTRVIYGGSVKPANAPELAAQADIDGFLVGGASLVAKDFIQIVQAKK